MGFFLLLMVCWLVKSLVPCKLSTSALLGCEAFVRNAPNGPERVQKAPYYMKGNILLPLSTKTKEYSICC